ncbi:MAG: hypothetical protein KIT89_09360 [Microcella sp.]|uniref:hypothetical protein n=1 Tax=Microcella sp. TaxID=1913979 RepID=UPI0024C6A43C|nr:hypothetical protein [Microcella sp.]UYN82915.1 MAG: hypothetical protein KIT89_09360 [Microcella sp.]
MTVSIPPRANIAEAWVDALDVAVTYRSGVTTNLVLTVTDPLSDPHAGVADLVGMALAGAKRQRVETVANTLFPRSLYRNSGPSWFPGMSKASEEKLNACATRLYENYIDMLETLKTEPTNRRGTYFSRMITWPGKDAGGVNQLSKRVEQLRNAHERNQASYSAADLTLEKPGEAVTIMEYAADDNRTMSFPCLVHISMTVHEGRLSLTALYRNWFLITRGFGNLVGLSRLLAFLCDQTGYTPGELVIHATKVSAEFNPYRKREITSMVESARAVLSE